MPRFDVKSFLQYVRDPENRNLLLASSVVAVGVIYIAFSSTTTSASSSSTPTSTSDATTTTTTITAPDSSPPSQLRNGSTPSVIVSPPQPSSLQNSGTLSHEIILAFLHDCLQKLKSDKAGRCALHQVLVENNLTYDQTIQQHITNETWRSLNINPMFGEQIMLSEIQDNAQHKGAFETLVVAKEEMKLFVLLGSHDEVDKYTRAMKHQEGLQMKYADEWRKELSQIMKQPNNSNVMKEYCHKIGVEYKTVKKELPDKSNERGRMIAMMEMTDKSYRAIVRGNELLILNRQQGSNSTRVPRSQRKSGSRSSGKN